MFSEVCYTLHMKFYNEDVEGPTLAETHHKYVNEFGSLELVCDWLKEEYGININRQRLSREYKNRGLFVKSPNGWPEKFYTNLEDHLDAESRLACNIIEAAWEDMLDYELRIHYLSACVFLAGDFYESCLGTILRNVKHTSINTDMLPDGIAVEDVIRGREIYQRNFKYWVES